MERLARSFQVETIYERVYKATDDAEPQVRLEVNKMDFTSQKRSEALNRAKIQFNKILKEGLEGSAGSIIKIQISPNAIKQISIIDIDKMEEEQKAILEEKAAAYDEAMGEAQSASEE